MKQTARLFVCVLSFLLITSITSIMSNCGGSSGPSTNAYVGTQTAGDFWTWSTTTTGSGETFTATNQVTGYTYSGTAAALSGNAAGFTKLTYTSSSDPNVAAGATAYQVEIPGTILMATPAPFNTLSNGDNVPYTGSNNAPLIAIAQGACPTSGGTFNWIMMPPKEWCSGDDPNGACPTGNSLGPAFGTATITVSGASYSMTTQPYLLHGTAQTPTTMTGATCSNGVISGTDSQGLNLKVSFTPSGMFFIDLPSGHGSMVGADASTTVTFSDLLKSGRQFVGWNFTSIRQFVPDNYVSSTYIAADTQPVNATTDGTTINGIPFTTLDSGTLQPNPGTSSPITLVSQALSPGLIQATITGSKGTQDIVLMVKLIGGKYYLFDIQDHWNSNSGAVDEMSGKNAFLIEQ